MAKKQKTNGSKEVLKAKDGVLEIKLSDDDLVKLDKSEKHQASLTEMLGQLAYQIRLMELRADDNMQQITTANQKLNEILKEIKIRYNVPAEFKMVKLNTDDSVATFAQNLEEYVKKEQEKAKEKK